MKSNSNGKFQGSKRTRTKEGGKVDKKKLKIDSDEETGKSKRKEDSEDGDNEVSMCFCSVIEMEFLVTN